MASQQVSFILLCLSFITSNAQLCTPHGSTNGTGDCVPAKNCPRIHQHFQPIGIPDFVLNFGCGVDHETKNVLVCCPRILPVINTTTSDDLSSTTTNVSHSGDTNLGTPKLSQNCGFQRVNEGAPWPFVVGLGRVDADNDDRIVISCPGVLIRPQWILAHPLCFQLQLITTAFFGIGHADKQRITKVEVDQLRRPDNYDPHSDLSAVGLARLKHPVTLTDDIQLICFPVKHGLNPTENLFAMYIRKIEDGTPGGGFEIHTIHPMKKVDITICRASTDIGVFPTINHHMCTNGINSCVKASWPLGLPMLLGQDTRSGAGFNIVGLGGDSYDWCKAEITSFYVVNSSKSKYSYINRVIDPSTLKDHAINLHLDLMGYFTSRQDITVCGRRKVGKGRQLPFVVSLGNRFFDDAVANWTFSSHCTGVIVAPSWVLTDAHCLHNKVINHIRGEQGGEIRTLYKKIDDIRTPPDYTPGQEYNTVALVHLETPIVFTEHMQPVCLPSRNSYDTFKFIMSISVGYFFEKLDPTFTLATGVWHVKREPHEKCRTSRFILSKLRPEFDACTTIVEVCNGYISPPVFIELGFDRNTFLVVGVGGENANYCSGNFMSHVRVQPHIPWIESVISPSERADIYDLTEITRSFNEETPSKTKHDFDTVTFEQLLEVSKVHNLDLFEVFVKNKSRQNDHVESSLIDNDQTLSPQGSEPGQGVTHSKRDFFLASSLSSYSSQRNPESDDDVVHPSVDSHASPDSPNRKIIVLRGLR